MKNEHEFDTNDVFSYVLILHLNSTLFIWKKATINSIIVYSYYTWYLLDRIVFKLLLYYQKLMFPVLVVKLIGSLHLISLSIFSFVILELDWKFRSINKFAESIRLIKLAISIPSIINFLNNPAKSWGKIISRIINMHTISIAYCY